MKGGIIISSIGYIQVHAYTSYAKIPLQYVAVTVTDTDGSAVDLYARLENFEEIHVEKLQVFANTITDQNLELIPLSEFPENWNQTEIFDTPPQNL